MAKSSSRLNFPPILTWHDPIKSGTLFGELLAILLVLRYGNLLRVSLRLIYWSIGLTTVAEYVSRKFYGSKKGLVSSYKPSRFIGVSQSSLEVRATKLAHCFADSFASVKHVIDGEDLCLSSFIFLSAVVGYILTGFLSMSGLLLLTLVSSFSIPPIYLQFQHQIDDLIDVAHKELGDKYDKVHKQVSDAAEPHITKAKTHINKFSSTLGLNRGGFPTTPAEKKAAPVSKPEDIPGPAAKAAEPVVKSPKISETATAADTAATETTSKAPSVAEVLANADSVPTLIGNVSLDHSTNAPGATASTEGDKTGDLISDLQESIKTDKESILN